MRLTPTYIAATLSLCAISNLALGQSIEPQLEAPAPDITTFDAGESYTTTSDTKNDIDIRILDGGTLINGVGYDMHNNGTIDVQESVSTFQNDGTFINGDNGSVLLKGSAQNHGTFINRGEINSSGNGSNYFGNYGSFISEGSSASIGVDMLNWDAKIINKTNSTLRISSDVVLYDTSNLTNDGILINDGNIGGIFAGVYVPDDKYYDTTIINNDSLINNGYVRAGNLINHGSIQNDGNEFSSANFTNWGTFTNNAKAASPEFGDLPYAQFKDDLINHGNLINNEELILWQYVNSANQYAFGIHTIQNYGTLRNNDEIFGNVAVKSSGVLTGDGTINGSVTLEGAINPGNSTGTITTGSQIWMNEASYGWEVNDSDGTQGGLVGWDMIQIAEGSNDSANPNTAYSPQDNFTTDGTLDLTNLTTGGFGIDIISLDTLNAIGAAEGFDDPNGEYEFVILTAIGGITGFEAEDFVLNDDGFQNSGSWEWSIDQDGNNLVLSATGYTLVPEPTSTALLALGGLAVMLRRKPLR